MREKFSILSVFVIGLSLFVSSCTSKVERDVPDEKITIGKVQREIRVGMSSADVVAVLGSPNIVTTDSERRETWVYDKVSTEISSSASSSGAWILILGFGSGKSSSSSSQRTLTVIVKFDANSRVRDFSYRTSSF